MTTGQLRGVIADWLLVLGATALLLSLFMTWSHQFSPAFAAVWADDPALAGVPRDPTAWQVYSAADVCLALVAAGIFAVAFSGGRRARLLTLVPVGIATAFVVHALSVPPTNGLTVVSSTGVADRPTSGFGELLALIALGVAALGLALSLTVD